MGHGHAHSPAGVAIEAIFHVIKHLHEVEKEHAFSLWQSDVGSKLSALLRSNELVIDEMQRMGLQFRQDLQTAFRTEYVSRLQAELLNLSAIMASLPDRTSPSGAAKARLAAAVERTRLLAYTSGAYGPATAPLSLTAAAVVMSVMQIAGMSAGEQAITREQFRDHVVAPVLDKNVAGSLGHALDAALDRRKSALVSFQSTLGQVTVGMEPISLGADGKVRATEVTPFAAFGEVLRDENIMGGAGGAWQLQRQFVKRLHSGPFVAERKVRQYISAINGTASDPSSITAAEIEIREIDRNPFDRLSSAPFSTKPKVSPPWPAITTGGGPRTRVQAEELLAKAVADTQAKAEAYRQAQTDVERIEGLIELATSVAADPPTLQ